MRLTRLWVLGLLLIGHLPNPSGTVAYAEQVPIYRSNAHHGQQLYLRLSSRNSRLRRLQQLRPAPAPAGRPVDVPQCLWNDVREVCTLSQLSYLSVSSPPVTVFHRAAVMAYARNLACNGHPGAASCNRDKQNRCFYWNKSCVGMDGYELVDWVAADPLDGQAAVLAFTCKGTDAAAYKECSTATDAGADGICNQLASCQYSKQLRRCVPRAWAAQDFAKLNSTKQGLEQFSLQVWGSCAGACYVRQASSCIKLDGNATACKRKPYCVWDFNMAEGSRGCIHRDTAARATDKFSKELGKFKDSCISQKSQESCEQPRVVPRTRGMYKSQGMELVVTEAAAACPL